ncbi:MAG TPA: hypothetical protein QGF95_06170 [Candidatus Latescibacteria bacterium]|jgi:hypothetical protein|nr:hypothetical protein [Gemmatimonadaceae bacterium]MDP6014632.1 hypothetical protein [Candidatus Latescibacterota bacterium]HJP30122.1 hypothetical protein [Candidatus Latescibacterota bacterium]
MSDDPAVPLPLLEATQPTTPPAWAVLERRLIDAIDEAAPVFLDRYTRPGGALIWQEEYPGDGVWADDLYEAFFNWPQYHALGGSDYCGEKSFVEWNAITRQLAVDYGRVTDEFVNDDDWFHNAENYIYFYALGMVDPTVRDNVDRARRFAGYYTGDNPEVRNYDPVTRTIPSPFSGSRGPLFHARWGDVRYNLEYGHTTLGPGAPALPEGWHEDAELRQRVHERFDHVVMRSDVVVNLGTVPLVATAFLYTGDERYRRWIVDYVEAWIERTRANDGVLPDNIGPSGQIGEHRDGQWWGGHYGWTGLYGHQMMGCALTIAAEAAQLITGDMAYLDLPRLWLDLLLEKSTTGDDGQLLVPHNHTTEASWTNHQPVHPHHVIHLWSASMADADWQRLERFRTGDERGWATVTSRGPRAPDDRAWTRWLAGELPGYPEEILQANYREVCRRLELVMADEQDLTKMDVHHWQQVNPVLTEALVHLTTGGPQTVYWGGLAVGRVRYYDAENRRSGLPADVAALVRELRDGSVTVSLVNLSVRHTRDVIIGAGSFGEHTFSEVRVVSDDSVQPMAVDGPWLRLRMRPGTETTLNLGMRRFDRQPGYAFPWHGDSIPVR